MISPEALDFATRLHREFNARREELLARRVQRRARLQSGEQLRFLPETAGVREGEWHVAPAPRDLDDRRVEITGPVERKMMINALNSGAQVFMADFEDALSPTWENVVDGQANLRDAVRRALSFDDPRGKAVPARRDDRDAGRPTARLAPGRATRRWSTAGRSRPACSTSDFTSSTTRATLLEPGSGPYFYLPKLESHLEARLWNDVFNSAQDALGIPRGTIRATVLIETILAAFEMEEILYELREHAAGLNAGRWDYIFSIIKTFRERRGSDSAGPRPAHDDRAVHAGLHASCSCGRAIAAARTRSAGWPRSFPAAGTPRSTRARSRRSARTRNARPAMVSTARGSRIPISCRSRSRSSTRDSATRPNQKDRHARRTCESTVAELLDLAVPNGAVTLAGVETNVDVALQYIEAWLRGQGAVGDPQPDGRRGDGGDLALPALAVGASRSADCRRRHDERAGV